MRTISVYCTFSDFEAQGDYPAPYVYRESHVLPTRDDPRGGSVDLGSIPAFLTRDGYDDGADDGACWPYLRVSVRAAERPDGAVEDTVVLDRRQVVALRDELTGWLARVDEGLTAAEGLSS